MRLIRSRRLAPFIRDALISVGFFHTILSPYFLFVIGLGWSDYGRWALTNIGLSVVLGPVLLALHRWFETPKDGG